MACTCTQEVAFDANLIQNSTLDDGLAGWAPLGSCTKLSVHNEEPAKVPTETINDVADDYRPSGRYILAAGRGDEKAGLCQAIAGALKPRVTYRVAGWISLGDGAEGEHAVRVNICMGGGDDDDEKCLVEGGAVCAEAGKWTEIKGVFRLKSGSSGVAVYVQGAPAGVDVKVMDLQVFATDRKARFRKLRKKTDKAGRRPQVQRGGSDVVGHLRRVHPRDADGHELRVRRVHQPRRDPEPGLRGLLRQALRLGGVRERAQVVPHGAAAGAAQLRRHRRAARLLRPLRQARARPLHLLGRRQHRAAVGQGPRRRRPAGRRRGPPDGPAHPLRRPVPALRRQQRDAARQLLPGPPRRRHRRLHVPRGRADRPGRHALRQRLQRRGRQRPQRHAGEVHRPDRRAAAEGRARRRHRPAGARHQPGGGGHLRRARQARHHRPARLAHRARCLRGRRRPPRRGPRGGAPGGLRAPRRGGHHILGVHAGTHVAPGRLPRQLRRHRQRCRRKVHRSPARVDVARARSHRQRRQLQVQGVPWLVRRAAHHGDGEDAQDIHRREGGHPSRAGYGRLTITVILYSHTDIYIHWTFICSKGN